MKHLQKSLSLFLSIVLCLSFFPFPAAYAEENIEEVESVSETEELEQTLIQDETAFDEDQEAQPHEHSYVAVVTEPTCTEQGFTTYICDCGDSYVDDYTDTLNHPEIIDVPEVPATETEPGTTAGKKCAVCGKILEGCEEIPVLEEVVTTSEAQPDDDSLVIEEEENSVVFETVVEEETVSDVARGAVVHSGTWGDNITWTLDDAGTLTISGTGPMSDFSSTSKAWLSYKTSIKEVKMNSGVTSIGASAFFACNDLKRITIPSTVTSIGHRAFHECSDLTSITIPSSVSNIGMYAFYECNSLVTAGPIGSGCDYEFGWAIAIPDNAFQSCHNLARVSIPESVISIGNNAFASCSSLTNIVLPSGITNIGYGTFSACRNLKTIFLPLGVTSIGAGAFADCSNLTEVHFMGSPPSIDGKAFINVTANAYYPANKGWTATDMQNYGGNLTWKVDTVVASGTCGAQGDNLTWTLYDDGELVIEGTGDMRDNAFNRVREITKVVIKEGVTSIGYCAFAMDSYLTSITIPSSVTYIGPFGTCPNLATIYVEPTNPAYCVFDGALYSRDMTTLWRAPSSRQNEVVIIPDGVKHIGESAFMGCAYLKSVALPDSVTSIDKYGFSNCINLATITIPESTTTIGFAAFGECSCLTEIHFLGVPSSIGNSAFYKVTADVYYPAGKDWTSANMQNYGGNLTWIPVEQDITIIDSGTWGDNITWKLDDSGILRLTGNGQMIQPDKEGDESLYPWYVYRNEIKEIIIDSGVMGISAYAFGHTAVEEVQLPSGLKSIASYAFYQCYNLTTVNFPDSLEYIGSFAFVSTSVKSFTIPVNTYYIGDGALCTNNLESIIVIPANTQFVTDINGILYDKTHHDYSNCYTLLACPKTVRGNLYIDDKVSVIAAYAFKGCSNLNSVTVSANLITIGAFAFTYSGLHEIKFAGPPPAFSDKSFAEVTANAYYPANKGWTATDMQNYGGNLTWIPFDPAGSAVFRTTLNMADYTGINVYVTLPEGEYAGNYTLKTEPEKSMYSYGGKEVSLGTIRPNAAGEYYVADVMKAASTEMTDTVKVTLLKNGVEVKSETYSVYSIVDERLKSGGLDGPRDRLNRALLQYGRLAQIRFGHKTGNLPVVSGAPSLTTIPSSYAAKGDPTNMTKYISQFEAKIEMADAVKMNVYLTPAAGYGINDFEISMTCAGAIHPTMSAPVMRNGKIFVQISGLLSYEMDKDVRITVKLKNSPYASATWTRSLITCTYENYQAATTDDRRNLMMSVYQYFLAAQNRFLN